MVIVNLFRFVGQQYYTNGRKTPQKNLGHFLTHVRPARNRLSPQLTLSAYPKRLNDVVKARDGHFFGTNRANLFPIPGIALAGTRKPKRIFQSCEPGQR